MKDIPHTSITRDCWLQLIFWTHLRFESHFAIFSIFSGKSKQRTVLCSFHRSEEMFCCIYSIWSCTALQEIWRYFIRGSWFIHLPMQKKFKKENFLLYGSNKLGVNENISFILEGSSIWSTTFYHIVANTCKITLFQSYSALHWKNDIECDYRHAFRIY